jgi:hypothetical protein
MRPRDSHIASTARAGWAVPPPIILALLISVYLIPCDPALLEREVQVDRFNGCDAKVVDEEEVAVSVIMSTHYE